MGTNFYSSRRRGGVHIGKRSAAGAYCWDCGITLCMGGKKYIHDSGWDWYDRCPNCGAEPVKEDFENSSGGLELGFAGKEYPKSEKIGVRSCSSFTWAVNPETVGKYRHIYDEYGRKFKRKDFLEMLWSQCPIRYYDLIGFEFS